MPRGGARPGAGAKLGVRRGPQKRTELALRRWANQHLNPDDPNLPAIDVMRDNLKYHHLRAREEALRLREYFIEHGATPQEMLDLVRLYRGSRDKAQEVARDLIKYEMPTLSQVTIKTLDLSAADDVDLNSALISMGSDIEALYSEIVTDADEEEPVPAEAAE